MAQVRVGEVDRDLAAVVGHRRVQGQRALPVHGLGLNVEFERAADSKLVSRVKIEVELPDAFPEKYRDALLRAIDTCLVKRQLANPPSFAYAIAPAERAIA